MKRVIKIFLLLIVTLSITACGTKSSNEEFSGKVTDLSKLYLSKGYIVNMYRSVTPLGDDEESYGKGYVTMTFNVLSEYTSIADYDPEADYNIKKMAVTNVRVVSTSKMGIVEDIMIMETYSQTSSDPHVDVTGTKDKYEIINETPHSTGIQSSITLSLNKIALYDSTKSSWDAQPSLSEIYNSLGITRNSVAIKLGFRIELTTVSNEVLYKDYVVDIPPVGSDITGSEFHYDFMKDNVAEMEPFLEKN